MRHILSGREAKRCIGQDVVAGPVGGLACLTAASGCPKNDEPFSVSHYS